jgi:hypothetical protein
MKKVLALAAFLAFASLVAFAENWSGTGYVSDNQCAVSGSKAKKASDWVNPDKFESCVQKCAKAGSQLVFVTEDNKILKFDADSLQKVTPLLGHRVSVTGTLENGTLKVDKVTGIKMDATSKPANGQEEKMHN